jgi:hypothetical protein
MYSWFYAHILNIYHFVDSALATSQNYPDSGLFIIQTSAPEDKVKFEVAHVLPLCSASARLKHSIYHCSPPLDPHPSRLPSRARSRRP